MSPTPYWATEHPPTMGDLNPSLPQLVLALPGSSVPQEEQDKPSNKSCSLGTPCRGRSGNVPNPTDHSQAQRAGKDMMEKQH